MLIVGALLIVSTVMQAQTLTTLLNFTGNNALGGAQPTGALVQGPDGNFYRTGGGGLFGSGIVFKVTPRGPLTTLHSFNPLTEGTQPSGLTLGADGNFYGTTEYGGPLGGTIFQITPSGMLTALYNLGGADNADAVAALTLGADGNFYGTTEFSNYAAINAPSADVARRAMGASTVRVRVGVTCLGAEYLTVGREYFRTPDATTATTSVVDPMMMKARRGGAVGWAILVKCIGRTRWK